MGRSVHAHVLTLMHWSLNLKSQVLYSGINNPQSQKFWEDVRSQQWRLEQWNKGRESRAPPNTAIRQRRRGRKV